MSSAPQLYKYGRVLELSEREGNVTRMTIYPDRASGHINKQFKRIRMSQQQKQQQH